jgi:hypothetical protein
MDGHLQHPLVDGLPCHVLQYVDDTLIILRAEEGAVRRLRSILDSFSRATGLTINFHKSTVVPMHVDEAVMAVVRDVLGCSVCVCIVGKEKKRCAGSLCACVFVR